VVSVLGGVAHDRDQVGGSASSHASACAWPSKVAERTTSARGAASGGGSRTIIGYSSRAAASAVWTCQSSSRRIAAARSPAPASWWARSTA
jgi:hypothetical protein